MTEHVGRFEFTSFKKNEAVVSYLLDGDVSIAFQTYRDLLGMERPDLQKRIPLEGWGKAFMGARNADGSWGEAFYRPKWRSTHYTILDLKALSYPKKQPQILESLDLIVQNYQAADGGLGSAKGNKKSDVCINALFLNYASYFGLETAALVPVIDFLMNERMTDGGFNCQRNRSGAKVSSLHSTLSAVEGFTEYLAAGHAYRREEVQDSLQASVETILARRLFRSRRTGEIIHKQFLVPTFPPRWRYNTLRALDAFRALGLSYDPRMEEALVRLLALRKKDGFWSRPAQHPGQTHFVMEPLRHPGRWATLLALRVLKTYGSFVT